MTPHGDEHRRRRATARPTRAVGSDPGGEGDPWVHRGAGRPVRWSGAWSPASRSGRSRQRHQRSSAPTRRRARRRPLLPGRARSRLPARAWTTRISGRSPPARPCCPIRRRSCRGSRRPSSRSCPGSVQRLDSSGTRHHSCCSVLARRPGRRTRGGTRVLRRPPGRAPGAAVRARRRCRRGLRGRHRARQGPRPRDAPRRTRQPLRWSRALAIG